MSEIKWVIDPAHSEIIFKVKHLMITNVTGRFHDFNAEVTTQGEDFSTGKINFAARTASIDTGNQQRDNHLRSDDFFKSETFPELRFESTSVEKSGANTYIISGNLSILQTTRPIRFEVELLGLAKDPYGNTKAGFSFQASLNRKDFGLTWNVPLETGGLLVSEEVKIICEIQLVRQ